MEIHFEIENRCLLKCRHCSSYATDAGKNMEYSVDDILRFLNLFNEKTEKEIFLTGGEPLLHPQIVEIIKKIKKISKKVLTFFLVYPIIQNVPRMRQTKQRKTTNQAPLAQLVEQ